MRPSVIAMTVVLCCGRPASAAPRLFYLDEARKSLAELDLETLAKRSITPVPYEVLGAPERLRITHDGRACFLDQDLTPKVMLEGKRRRPSILWWWDGVREHRLELDAWPENGDVWLAEDAPRIYWYENVERTTYVPEPGEDADTFRIRTTALGGGGNAIVWSYEFPVCRCQTGACEETCPVGVTVHPKDTIADTIVVNHFVEGQTQSEVPATVLLRRMGDGLHGEPLARPPRGEDPNGFDVVLDVSCDGRILVAHEADRRCCAWSNQSNDRTFHRMDGEEVVIFDEYELFGNPSYDISFYPSRALLSPDLHRVAMTVVSDAQHGAARIDESERTLVDTLTPTDAETDPAEHARLVIVQGRLPMVQIVTLDGSHAVLARETIDNAALVGWLADDAILIHRKGRLERHDVKSGARTELPLRIRSARLAFIR